MAENAKVTVRFVVDGNKVELEANKPEAIKFPDMKSALDFFKGDTNALLSKLSEGIYSLQIRNLRKNAKKAWLKQNDPNREAIRKQAATVFLAYTSAVFGEAMNRKQAKEKDAAKAKVLWERAMSKARKMFDENIASEVADLK